MVAQVSALPPHLVQSELARQLSRSPVNFREGRRSSDGLVSPVAFQQRLYCDQPESGAAGMLPLEQVSDHMMNETNQGKILLSYHVISEKML